MNFCAINLYIYIYKVKSQNCPGSIHELDIHKGTLQDSHIYFVIYCRLRAVFSEGRRIRISGFLPFMLFVQWLVRVWES